MKRDKLREIEFGVFDPALERRMPRKRHYANPQINISKLRARVTQSYLSSSVSIRCHIGHVMINEIILGIDRIVERSC